MKTSFKYNILALFIFSFMFAFSAQAAIDANIAVPESFSFGENLEFRYTITSDINTEAVFTPYMSCPSAARNLLNTKTINLKKGVAYLGKYEDAQAVNNSFEPETCIAYIDIRLPEKKYIEKDFTIKIDPSFNFRIHVDKEVYVLGDRALISHVSDKEDLEISATIIYPDNTSESIAIPSSIEIVQIGEYAISAIASKDGYKDADNSKSFRAISEHAQVKQITQACQLDNSCDTESSVSALSKLFSLRNILIAFGIIVILALAMASFFYFRSRDDLS